MTSRNAIEKNHGTSGFLCQRLMKGLLKYPERMSLHSKVSIKTSCPLKSSWLISFCYSTVTTTPPNEFYCLSSNKVSCHSATSTEITSPWRLTNQDGPNSTKNLNEKPHHPLSLIPLNTIKPHFLPSKLQLQKTNLLIQVGDRFEQSQE